MSAIDALLGIATMKNAGALVLATDEVPALLIGGARSPLTMPALSGEMLQDLTQELLTPALLQALAETGESESTHQSPQGIFTLRVKRSEEKLRLVFTRGGSVAGRAGAAATPRVPAAPPAAAPVSRPAAAASRPGSAAVSLPAAAPVSLPAAAPVSLPPAAVAPVPVPPQPALELPPGKPARRPPGSADHSFARLLREAVERGASDVLLSTGAPPLVRIRGDLVELGDRSRSLDADVLLAHVDPWLTPQRRQCFADTGSVDFALTIPRLGDPSDREPLRFRANLFRHLRGPALALRPIATEIPTLEELGLPSSLRDLTLLRDGLVVVTGATGAGKSTTVAAIIEEVNQRRACHIVTLEDPIEYLYPRRRAIVHQREVGEHVSGFAAGLRATLRENPDIIVVGEMRDAETMRVALTVAETGHLVFSTLHSGNAVMALERIIDAFEEGEKLHIRQQLAGVLRRVVAQRLLPGCDGRPVPAVEILSATAAVAAQIRDGRTHMLATQIETGANLGMVPMERALVDLVREGRITRQTALAAEANSETLRKLLDERAPLGTRRP